MCIRDSRIVDVHIEYIAAPSLNDRTLLLVDPMLATGESMELAWKALDVYKRQRLIRWKKINK